MRNFGLSHREAVGGNQLPGARGAHDTQRANSSSLHPFELGSHLLFLALLFLPIILVGGVAVGYLAFAPQPVEYHGSVEANRFKSH